jgi:hypothetical protein
MEHNVMVDSQKIFVCHNMLPRNMATLLGDAQDQGLHIQHLLEILQHQPRASTKQLRWDDTLVLLNVELIHKWGLDIVVLDVLNQKKKS